MDARDSGLTVSAMQLHHKVNQPLCLQAERAQERQLLLSPDVSERFTSGRVRRVHRKTLGECGQRVALLQRRTVTEVKHLRDIKSFMFALKD